MRQRSPFIVRERTKRNVSEPRGICLNHILNTSTILLKQSLEKETIRHMNIYKFIYIGIRMKKKPKLFDVKNTHLMYLGCFQFFCLCIDSPPTRALWDEKQFPHDRCYIPLSDNMLMLRVAIYIMYTRLNLKMNKEWVFKNLFYIFFI